MIREIFNKIKKIKIKRQFYLVFLIILMVVISFLICFLMNKKIEQLDKSYKSASLSLKEKILTYETELGSCQSGIDAKVVPESERRKTSYEYLPNSKYDLVIQESIDETNINYYKCKIVMENQINEAVESVQINGKFYSKIDICETGDKDCEESNYILNIYKINDFFSQNKYNIIDGCLYKDGFSVFNYSLYNYAKAGFFGGEVDGHTDTVDEWFRFENKNKLFIFLVSSGGCGGCVGGGDYLEIDLNTNQIEGKSAEIPYHIILSQDNKRAIEISWDWETYQTKLYLFDLISLKRKQIVYEIPENKTILLQGDGVWPVDDAIKWMSQDKISVQLYEKDESNDGLAKENYIEKDGMTNVEYVKSGSPKIINIAY